MFAPPPLQFSRAEIERLKNQALERQEATRQSAESTSAVESPTSLQRSERASRRLFARNKQLKVSSPIAQDEKQSSTKAKPQIDKGNVTEQNGQSSLPPPARFSEAPRKAPRPPKRPTRPPGDLFLPLIPKSTSPQSDTVVPPPQASPPPPPVPEKSPRRKSSTKQAQPAQVTSHDTDRDKAAFVQSLAQLGFDVPAHNQSEEPIVSPSSTTPAKPIRKGSLVKAISEPRRAKRATFAGEFPRQAPKIVDKIRLSGVHSGKIHKAPQKRAGAAAALEATLLELDYPGTKHPRRATEPTIKPTVVGDLSPVEQTPWKRRRKGETMSMLLDAGFFPAAQLTVHVQLPPPRSLRDKELPDTPDSILPTPTELYQRSPRTSLPPVPARTKPKRPRRSPLAQIGKTNAKVNSGALASLLSSGRLSAIPEIASLYETNSPISSGATTPVATQIHLRGGSVVTVTPPELTAWQKSEYIQGPIKLPKPAIMPRKNSVASLEPFQEAIDEVYQHALSVPRRRSDDAVVEDICEWFDEFGFGDIKYEGDTLMIEDIAIGEVHELDETDSQEMERFSTPPLEPVASPLQKAVAKEVIESSKPDPIPTPRLSPVENEESLRVRGMARLSTLSTGSNSSRKASGASVRKESVVSVTPIAEPSMLAVADDVPESPRKYDGFQAPLVDQGGFDWDDDVEELDEHSSWVAPAIARKKQGLHRGLSTRETRNPFTKMRRVVATASAIL